MDLNDYQTRAMATMRAPSVGVEGIYYRTLGLTGEAGEVANKVKKIIRDKNGVADPSTIADLRDELGDVLWYVATLADALGLTLNEIGQRNITKLAIRYRSK